MQTVRFGKKQDTAVIDIDDVVEDEDKIYCARTQKGELKFSIKFPSGTYCWIDLTLGRDAKGVASFKETLRNANCGDSEVLIFDSQCEVLEYAKKM